LNSQFAGRPHSRLRSQARKVATAAAPEKNDERGPFIGFCVDLKSVKCSLSESGEQIACRGVIVPGKE
jgi:hypothetical protein